MKKAKKILMNPWTITIGGGIIVGLTVSFIQDYQQQQFVFSTLLSWGKSIWHWIVLLLNFNIKVWWLLLAVLLLFAIIIVSRKIFVKAAPEPPFLHYTKDTLLNWTWEWEWTKDYYGKYDIENLHPICPKCGMPLVNDYREFNAAKCMRCNKLYSATSYPDIENVKVYIIDNARKGKF